MEIRRVPQAREEGRHWLPSQGVDPGPLAELNNECLGLLAIRAAESECDALMPPLLESLRGYWANMPSHAARRLSGAPFMLFDAGFALAPRWLELRSSGVHDAAQRAASPYFDPVTSRSIT